MIARALLAAALAAVAGPAAALQCGPAAEVRQWLGDTYRETVVFAGLSAQALVELWIGPAGSWTVVAISPQGRACVALAGSDGALVPQGAPGEPG